MPQFVFCVFIGLSFFNKWKYDSDVSLTRGFPVRPSKRSKSFLPSLRSVNISFTGAFPLCRRKKKSSKNNI